MNVYFMVAKNQTKRLLKIGKANDPARRLKQIQVGCPYRITLFSVIRCRSDQHAFAVEKAAHEVFKHKRCRNNGEWFRFTKDVQSEVSRFCEIAGSKESACLSGILS